MPRYLVHGSYTDTGMKGLLAVGGTARRSHFDANVRTVGGSVESFDYALGGEDIYAVVEMPDATAAAALTMAINSGGAFHASATALLTPEQVDRAAHLASRISYREPGT